MYDYKAGNHWDGTLHNKDEYQILNITHGQETGSVEYGRGYQINPPVTEKPWSSAQGGRIARQDGRSLNLRECLSQISRPRIWVIWMRRSAQGGTKLEKADGSREKASANKRGPSEGMMKLSAAASKIMRITQHLSIIEHRTWLLADQRSSGSDVKPPVGEERSDVKHAQTLDPPVDTHIPVYNRRICFSDCGVTRERANRPNADSLGLVSKIYFQIEMTVDLEGCGPREFCVRPLHAWSSDS
ncbi:hypothetical protein ARMGADRAFT_1032397 [Armillaria gallica]|uniref:Uncharacterized protein n=1 Tax=Armillaria gallica TaxID=47427 RepID=A0A2H3DHL0_ARMGA|nr:hypothetical protein ARMGADRAFT_1032397 [Armillaria gallica]